MTGKQKYQVTFKQKNTSWKCDVYAEGGVVTVAGELFNVNTGRPWAVPDFSARYGMSDHEFLCMVAGHLELESPAT